MNTIMPTLNRMTRRDRCRPLVWSKRWCWAGIETHTREPLEPPVVGPFAKKDIARNEAASEIRNLHNVAIQGASFNSGWVAKT